ncbi:MAG: PQQ-dependent sugar dehydrogenase, partial [Planctomycetota bacterium]|nr:PQQ-dependent sugar dehydrogenase [Planctomycetota bacterium]
MHLATSLLRAGRSFSVTAIASVALLLPLALNAATVPAGFSDSTTASGLSSPTAMEIAPDGRIFVAEQTGALRVIKNGVLLPTPFLTLSVSSSGERGLIGITLDPDFVNNGYVYVYYTASASPIHNRVSRFSASIDNPDVAEPGETVLLDLETLGAWNHNGGAMHFGADGKLYVTTGDNAVGSNSQSLGNLLGKVLRINSDGTIPPDNAFYGLTTGSNRAIWALGLRNPFTFAIQPGTGRMMMNDVGQDSWEEIDEGIAGANYGWPTSEGPANCTIVGFTCPIYSYDQSQGCAVTGGVFYDPAHQSFPERYAGKYFFADYCGNWIKFIDPYAPPEAGAASTLATGVSSPVDLRVGSDGSLYYLSRSAGAVGRIEYASNEPPSITQQPERQTVPIGGTATFSVSAAGSQLLQYQWQRNQVDILGANAATFTLADVQPADDGSLLRCKVVNDFGSVFSDEALLTVTANRPPTGTITEPEAGARYNAGQTIAYAGTASDDEDPSIPASEFTWRVDFHHDAHAHPFIAPFSGVTSGTFQIANTGETAANVWYRVYLTVRDSGGLSHTSYRDIVPNTATLTLASNPAGLQLTLDSQPVTAPISVVGVVGMQRAIGGLSSQTMGGTTYQFASWSDGGALNHTITPALNATYTATYSVVTGQNAGTGLLGQYFNNKTLSGTVVRQQTGAVIFNWGTRSPGTSVNADNFSARWTGTVEASSTGVFRFQTKANDGVRLWVNGAQVINNWANHSTTATNNSAAVALTGGTRYPIVMEYY